MKSLLTLYILVIPLLTKAQDLIVLNWGDLKPVTEIEDPFMKLTKDQLYNVSKVVVFRQWEVYQDEPLSVKNRRDKDSLEHLLSQEGIDIDYLLSMRDVVAEQRKKEGDSTKSEYNGRKISISGYLLPLNYADEQSTEFLLVPWVGACIHTPPPPKNQIVYLIYDQGYKVASLFEAVSVEGIMNASSKTSNLFLVDGASKIPSGYTLATTTLKAYK